jgi:hypothetical protein
VAPYQGSQADRTDSDPMTATQFTHTRSDPALRGVTARIVRGLFASSYLKRAAAAIWMNLLIAAIVTSAAITSGAMLPTTTVPDHPWTVRALSLFAIWLLSFTPGWLYVRFLGLRADALWNEYVLNLYRLGIDDVKYLAPPPAESAYAEVSNARVGGTEAHNIYRQKFNAYYGRRVSKGAGNTENFCVSVETLFPVFLCTATLAVIWSVVLWNPSVLLDPIQPWASLQFGFLGAYAFAVSMLVRRFYQSDLRPSAYASVVLRIVVVFLLLVVLHQFFAISGLESDVTSQSEYVSAFVVGFFPPVGLQAIQRAAAKTLRVVVPQLTPTYPLDQLDGLNIWYEARLVEEGVEDMQNLTTVDLVDVLLHTRAPMGRIIDWIDQAFLLVHLDPAAADQLRPASPARRIRKSPVVDSSGPSTRVALRSLGIRSATDFLKAFPVATGREAEGVLSSQTVRGCGLDPAQLQLITRLLSAEPGLNPVWNWKAGGPQRTR